MSVTVASLGFPRIGPRRELKKSLEDHWAGRTGEAELLRDAAALRAAAWARLKSAGIDWLPSNDFSLYDHVLDTSAMVGAIPAVYGDQGSAVPLATYFAMARGTRGAEGSATCVGHTHDHARAHGLPALEMTKWFDTNYHYMVPEFTAGQTFRLASTKPIDEFLEARSLGFATRPVLLGPVTYLLIGKSREAGTSPLTLLPGLLEVYGEVLRRLQAAGASWVQIDEPALVLDLDDDARKAFETAYRTLAAATPSLKLMLTTYFGDLRENLETALALPVAGLHLDLVRAPHQLDEALTKAPPDLVLSLGVIDGRNVWRADLEKILDWIEPAVQRLGPDRVMLAPSCSLLHVPIDLAQETNLDRDLTSWLAFATQKLEELRVLASALNQGRNTVSAPLREATEAAAGRRTSAKIHHPDVQSRLAAVTPAMAKRRSTFDARRDIQQSRLNLPVYPTTTIGSFPQTKEVRNARADHQRGTLSDTDYNAFLKRETEAAVHWQESIGIDVLVHGEFERNDMVQYFGEQLSGYAFTRHGWVQSYGSRYVRPPIIFGDVSRPTPMTVGWSAYAQSLTPKPMKGMLTGPVTMLQWSFVRDDQPRQETCRQIALALRDEVTDLEKARIAVIQIDEPALREGLPLRKADWKHYLDWAVQCFGLTAGGVDDATQIHTHMCYSEFNDIIEAIGALDADVISIETARSKMELLDAFTRYRYPNEIGPGVYDIHAPRQPTVGEMAGLLAIAGRNLSPGQIWVNPDCGLKTRTWDEVKPALLNMVEAARQMRQSETSNASRSPS
ncbi:MAG: 5-methyltetrahydropteroyltriglutamate--homocysteine S-methyltransferase [Alphaproteobacteria bacterium 65-37]|nr:5-methyltetrahydropteroyltriglutamate--homocysteine S-methyltransferase [Alphaproteobacteria bacterium]OJU31958.1 MAG: 5-methyltetrahydropteroyltriglutamate--homocysteine S-methyltransferase [Alphaproteobacteria bacterium 65-37]